MLGGPSDACLHHPHLSAPSDACDIGPMLHHLTHKVNRVSNEKGMLGMWEIWSDITSASPNGNSKSPVGTSCTDARYKRFGSKKMVGLRSRMHLPKRANGKGTSWKIV